MDGSRGGTWAERAKKDARDPRIRLYRRLTVPALTGLRWCSRLCPKTRRRLLLIGETGKPTVQTLVLTRQHVANTVRLVYPAEICVCTRRWQNSVIHSLLDGPLE